MEAELKWWRAIGCKGCSNTRQASQHWYPQCSLPPICHRSWAIPQCKAATSVPHRTWFPTTPIRIWRLCSTKTAAASGHALSHHFLGDLTGLDLQSGSGHTPIQTILSQESQRMAPPISSTQFLTPPSQHSYSNPMDNTPCHQPQVPDHPFLTPSPGSPDQWSSSSPHSNLSDWSEGISSPPTNMQMNHIPEAFK